MSNPTVIPERPLDLSRQSLRDIFSHHSSHPPGLTQTRKSVKHTILLGFLGLLVIFVWRIWASWATWGNLSIDCGREMYVPALLASGKTLYRDVWYLYHPAAPYINSVLFRLFGIRLVVLYIAGSLAALGSAVFLFLSGIRLSFPLAGWAAAAVVLLQAFESDLFSFPLPYSFASVYGCLTACLFLWLLLSASESASLWWIAGLGFTAATALLLKLEYGAVCYVVLGLLLLIRLNAHKSWSRFRRELLAILPGVLICLAVAVWMISLRGLRFLLDENLAASPGSYFMRTYGKFWLASTGMAINAPAFRAAAFRALFFAAWILGLCCLLLWRRFGARLLLFGILCIALAGLTGPWIVPNTNLDPVLCSLFFPQDMVLYIAIAASIAWLYFWRVGPFSGGILLPFTFTFSSLLAFRMLLNTIPSHYPIYYDGPVVLSFLCLIFLGIGRIVSSEKHQRWGRFLFAAAVLFTVCHHALSVGGPVNGLTALHTERGTIYVDNIQAQNYQVAIRFMRQNAAMGNYVLSVPEDTSLYFFSGTHAPTRLFMFTPGLLSPGDMTAQLFRELEANPPRYLLWSNRRAFPEYGVPGFGINFDQPLGNYFKSHYRPLGFLPGQIGEWWQWHVVLWERIQEGGTLP